MKTNRFFESLDRQNIIKTKIVTKYFGAWTTVMLPKLGRPEDRLAYIDLFAGPGRFEDGKASTPLWILNYAIQNPKLCSRLVTTFNDKKTDYANQLLEEVRNLPNVENLKYPPQVTNISIGSQIADIFHENRLEPTLFFIDPWGYKGLSLELIGNTIKQWGCDCIFFFNYNRINPGITNPAVIDLMDSLFGTYRAEGLRQRVRGRTPDDRQSMIIDELIGALGDVGGKYVLPFEFESRFGDRPSHYIIFVSKEFRGYHIMKEVMASLSTDDWEVKRFEYVPMISPQMALFEELARSHSIAALKDLLALACAGKVMKSVDVYEKNTVGTPYTNKNVKDAIIALEAEGRVTVDKSAKKRMRLGNVTLGDDRVVTFRP